MTPEQSEVKISEKDLLSHLLIASLRDLFMENPRRKIRWKDLEPLLAGKTSEDGQVNPAGPNRRYLAQILNYFVIGVEGDLRSGLHLPEGESWESITFYKHEHAQSNAPGSGISGQLNVPFRVYGHSPHQKIK